MKAVLVSLALLFSLLSCSSSLWNHPLDEAKSLLAKGDYSFLQGLSDSDLIEPDAAILGDGANYALGVIFEKLGKLAASEALFRKSLNRDPVPWRTESGMELFDLYSDKKDWVKAEAVARRLLGDNPRDPEVQRLLFQTLYWQKKDPAAWSLLKGWKPGVFSSEKEKENLLFRAVLQYRLGFKRDASASFNELIFRYEASELHYRAYSFFEEDPKRYDLVGPAGKNAVLFQSLVYQGQPDALMDWLKTKPVTQEFWNNRIFVTGIETLFKNSQAETGLNLLEQFRTGLKGEARFAAEYARGRLYRSLERWGEARAAFQDARVLAVSVADRQKTAWNWLLSWVNLQPTSAADAFRQVLGETPDPAYFSDVLSAWITQLVQARSWIVLTSVYRDLSPYLTVQDRTSVGFILARLARHGFIDLKKEGLSKNAEQLLQDCIDLLPTSYEGLMARAVLGQEMNWAEEGGGSPLAPEADSSSSSDSQGKLKKDVGAMNAKFLESQLAFGLVQEAARRLMDSSAAVSPDLVRSVAHQLQDRQFYRDSLFLLYRKLIGPKSAVTRQDWELLYPQAYLDLATERSQTEKLDLSLLMGLMREESSFDPAARSGVGAVGLTQLMPDTAADTARRLRLKTYDLANPSDNLTLGAHYLASSLDAQGEIFLALMAYNAGGGRIKSWRATMGKLPEEIFVEAVPFTETRYYVKKVLSSAVMYGLLYNGKTLGQMVQLVYPGFAP